jgi:hypothetical protein
MMATTAARVMGFSFVISHVGYERVPVTVPVSITSLMILLRRTCVDFNPAGIRRESYGSDLLKYGEADNHSDTLPT